MASRQKQIKGITIEIDGNVTKLDKALDGVNKDLSKTQSELNDVTKLLKLDPQNTVLLEQKQRLLATAIGETKQKLDVLRQGVEGVNVNDSAFAEWEKAAKEFDAEISAATKELKQLETEQQKLKDIGFAENSDQFRDVQREIDETRQKLADLNRQAGQVYEEMGKPVPSDAYDAAQREIAETEQRLKSLEAQADDAGGGMAELGGKTGGLSGVLGELDGALGKVGGSLSGLAAGGAIALVAAAIKQLADFTADAVRESAALADEILALSQQSGLSTEFVQGLKLAAEEVDVSAETSINALEKFRNNLDSNSKATQEAFGKLGLSSQELISSGMSMDDMFRLVLERLGAIDDEMARDLISYDLFGKKADELAGITDDGGKKLFALIDGYKELGYVLSEEELQTLGKVDDQFQRMNNAMTLAKEKIAIELAPELIKLTDEVIRLIETADWDKIGRAASAVLKSIREDILPILEVLGGVLGLVLDIITAIIELNNAWNGFLRNGGAHRPEFDAAGVPVINGYATGGVFAPNSPMLIGVGDNRQEREVLAPESVIRGVVREELAGVRGGMVSPTFRIVFQGTPDAIGRALNPVILADDERVGAVL